MIGKVQRRDGELIVVIPEDVAKAEGIDENIVVEVRRAYPADYMTLEEMLDKITPETLHDPIDWGPDVGKEIIED